MSESAARELAWRFRLLPSSYCHESWLPRGLCDAMLPSRARHDGVCHRYLSPWMTEHFKLGCPDGIVFDDPLRRLALLDGEALQAIAPALGLLASRDALRQTLDGAALARLRAATGLDALGFMRASPDGLLPADMSLPQADLAGDDVAGRLAARGRVLLPALAGIDQLAVIRRLRLKFPRAVGLKAAPCKSPVHDRGALSSWLSTQLIPRIAPPWAWLFC